MDQLTNKEKEILSNLLGRMNNYEMRAMLCKTYEGEELESACDTLLKIYLKLNREMLKDI